MYTVDKMRAVVSISCTVSRMSITCSRQLCLMQDTSQHVKARPSICFNKLRLALIWHASRLGNDECLRHTWMRQLHAQIDGVSTLREAPQSRAFKACAEQRQLVANFTLTAHYSSRERASRRP